MTARRRLLLLLAVVLHASPAPGEPIDDVRFTAWGARELSWLATRPRFLSRQELLDLPLAPPPANSAPATRRELDELLRLQASRTPDELASIARHREYAGVCDAFFAVLGRAPPSLPKTRALLSHVDADVTVAVFNAKRRFNRARPTQLEPRLHASIPVPAHAAYPSGHALQAELVARVLAELAPARREALFAVAGVIAHEREVAGLHFASDSAASRTLGASLWARLVGNAAFRRELDDARSEWRGAD